MIITLQLRCFLATTPSYNKLPRFLKNDFTRSTWQGQPHQLIQSIYPVSDYMHIIKSAWIITISLTGSGYFPYYIYKYTRDSHVTWAVTLSRMGFNTLSFMRSPRFLIYDFMRERGGGSHINSYGAYTQYRIICM